jgi:hypothetical protein
MSSAVVNNGLIFRTHPGVTSKGNRLIEYQIRSAENIHVL